MNNNSQFKYYSSGTFGVVIKNELYDYVYKITEFTDYKYIIANNFNEMLYLNFFKLKYPKLHDKVDNNLPIQNISTNICTLEYFVKTHDLDVQLVNKIKNKLEINLIDLVIINKMRFYPYNLCELRKNLNFTEMYLGIEKIILGLHFFHSNGLAHGDFKSINIVSDIIDFKLIDFGGVKFTSNPKYECTCTYTYRAPEDLEFENKLRVANDKHILCPNNPLKSDIWSLGIVLNELVNGDNPVQIKYNSLITNGENYSQKKIEKKILLYLTNLNKKNTSSFGSLFLNASICTDLNKYKIIKIIEQMLNIEPEKRISLKEAYLNLFCQELPDYEKEKSYFNYKINNVGYYKKFIDFRNSYYKLIRFSLMNLNEEFLFPFISNLFDRFLITLINESPIDNDNYIKYKFLIDLVDDYGNFDNFGNFCNFCIDDNKYNSLLYNTNIISCAIYIIAKLVVLKKNIKFIKEITKIQQYLNFGWENITYVDISHMSEQIIGIVQILNYDIVRTKLFMYSNTDKKHIENIIQIIESFDIDKIIYHIE